MTGFLCKSSDSSRLYHPFAESLPKSWTIASELNRIGGKRQREKKIDEAADKILNFDFDLWSRDLKFEST